MRTQWNDEEDRALDYLPYLDQVIYLRGIRRRMDYASGVAGMSVDGQISYQWLAQMAEVRVRPCSTMKPPPRPDKSALRAIFDRLEDAGLIERVRNHGLKSLVFRCLLADRGSSVSNMSDPSATHQRPTIRNPSDTSNGAGCVDMSHPSATHEQPDMNDPIQVSGIRNISDTSEGIEMDRATPKPKRSRGSRLSIPDLPDEWRAFAVATRPDLDPEFCWQKFRDYWVGVPGQKGSKLDWLATWRNFIRSEHTPRRNGQVNGYGNHRQSSAERHRDINAELIARARAAAASGVD